jgi:hypothetical protein
MMHIGSFAVKTLGFFALGLFPQDKPTPAQAVPEKSADVKPGATVIVEGKKLDKPVEAKKVELIQLEGKKIEIREVEGKPNEAKKVVEYRIQAHGEGKSDNGVITIKVVGEPLNADTKTENRTITVTDIPKSGETGKPGVKTDTRTFVVEGKPIHPPGTTKVIKILVDDSGKVTRTETQDEKGVQIQTIELQGVLKSLENANPELIMETAIKKALEAAVKGEKLPVLGANSNVEIRRIQVVGPDMKFADLKPLIVTPSGNSATATTGTITVTQSPEASKLDAILKRLEKIEKTLEELKAKK